MQWLYDEYEKALQKTEVLTGQEAEDFTSLVGALQYACNLRPCVDFPVGIGGRCRTFPTKGMHRCMLRVLVYLGRTADMEIVYSGTGEGATKLIGRADSDWSIKRSTTGYYIALAGGTVSHRSHRQHCIAMSSTEAEMMAPMDRLLRPGSRLNVSLEEGDVLYVPKRGIAKLGYVFEKINPLSSMLIFGSAVAR